MRNEDRSPFSLSIFPAFQITFVTGGDRIFIYLLLLLCFVNVFISFFSNTFLTKFWLCILVFIPLFLKIWCDTILLDAVNWVFNIFSFFNLILSFLGSFYYTPTILMGSIPTPISNCKFGVVLILAFLLTLMGYRILTQ